MTAVEFLSQAYLMEQQIRSKKEQLVMLRSMATSFYNPTDQEQVSCTPKTYALEESVIKIVEAENELKAQVDQLVEIMMEIRRVIAAVQDVRLRLVLEKRYLMFQPWKEIAADMDRSVRWVQQKHVMALEVVERMMDTIHGHSTVDML